MSMINLCCPINNTTGYGISSTNIWSELRKKTDVRVFPIGGVALEDDSMSNNIRHDINNVFDSFNKKDPCIKIWHMHDLFNRIGAGKYGVLPFFEIDKLKPLEIAGLNHSDIIFVTCEWAKNVMVDNGIDSNKIFICPLAVDYSVFDYRNTIPDVNKDKYIFINIGKWEIRKTHDLLFSIFNEAFDTTDNVELWMVNHNPFLSEQQTQEWHRLYKNSKLGEKIRLFNRIPTHRDLAALISNADCGIYISRAEGWNNEILETMAMNKPVIATNYSAHTAYCNKDNSYLVDIDELEPAVDNIWFDGFGKWAKFGLKQVEQTIEHMRYVYKKNIRTNKAGLDTCQHFTWENTANIIYKHLIS